MAIRDGVKKVVHITLEVKDEICTKMIDAGVDPKEAVKASSVVTKDYVETIIDKALGNQNASEITSRLSELGNSNRRLR